MFNLNIISYYYSQTLSINLSIKWEQEDIVISDSLDIRYCPYLSITFYNLSNEPIFFLNPFGKDNDIPSFLPALGSDSSKNYLSLLYNKYSNNKYNVFISNIIHPTFYNQQWIVISSLIDPYEENVIDIINDDLNYIYKYLIKNNLNNNESTIDQKYMIDEITEEDILTELYDNFIFLREEETFQMQYSLEGFKILGGIFNFKFFDNELKSYVYMGIINDNNRWENKQIKLPYKVGEYELYYGKFFTNELKIEF